MLYIRQNIRYLHKSNFFLNVLYVIRPNVYNQKLIVLKIQNVYITLASGIYRNNKLWCKVL